MLYWSCDHHCPACSDYLMQSACDCTCTTPNLLFPVQASSKGDPHDAVSPALHNVRFADVLEGPLQVIQPPPRPLPCFVSR